MLHSAGYLASAYFMEMIDVDHKPSFRLGLQTERQSAMSIKVPASRLCGAGNTIAQNVLLRYFAVPSPHACFLFSVAAVHGLNGRKDHPAYGGTWLGLI